MKVHKVELEITSLHAFLLASVLTGQMINPETPAEEAELIRKQVDELRKIMTVKFRKVLKEIETTYSNITRKEAVAVMKGLLDNMESPPDVTGKHIN